MKQKRFPPDDPREWIRRAQSNLAHARAYEPDVDLADNCFGRAARISLPVFVAAFARMRGDAPGASPHSCECGYGKARFAGRLFAAARFDAQPCAEKAIKAVFVSRGETFPYVHDLKKLIHLLERNGVTIPKYLLQAEELTRYAFVTRYPGKYSSATERQYRPRCALRRQCCAGHSGRLGARELPPVKLLGEKKVSEKVAGVYVQDKHFCAKPNSRTPAYSDWRIPCQSRCRHHREAIPAWMPIMQPLVPYAMRR